MHRQTYDILKVFFADIYEQASRLTKDLRSTYVDRLRIEPKSDTVRMGRMGYF